MESRLLANSDDGLDILAVTVEGKGRGVIATKDFNKNEFIVEYAGDLIPVKEAKKREAMYASEQLHGGFMYHFRSLDKPLCIDATDETGRLGKPTIFLVTIIHPER